MEQIPSQFKHTGGNDNCQLHKQAQPELLYLPAAEGRRLRAHLVCEMATSKGS